MKTFSRKTAIVTVSDKGARGEREDLSGRALAEKLGASGFDVCFRTVIPDELEEIQKTLSDLADAGECALILTTGGTGVAPRDITPEATLSIIEKAVPGFGEAMRAASIQKTPYAMISRSVAGIRRKTLIINLPGSPKGAVENLEVILPALPHALDKIQGDTSDCAQPV